MEIVNLSPLDEIKVTSLGPGIELLMNDKKGQERHSVSISDIDKLETELNNLTTPEKPTEKPFEKMEFPRLETINLDPPREVKFDIAPEPVKPTWDGFKPFNGNPDKPEKTNENVKDKFTYLRKLEDLVRSMSDKNAVKSTDKTKSPAAKAEQAFSSEYQRIQSDLAAKFDAKVSLKADKSGSGSIQIPFISTDDLNRILEMLDW